MHRSSLTRAFRPDVFRRRCQAIDKKPVDLAAEIGTSETMVYRYAAGLAVPTTDRLAAIARALEISSDELLGLTSAATR